jgi:hypothetical protein
MHRAAWQKDRDQHSHGHAAHFIDIKVTVTERSHQSKRTLRYLHHGYFIPSHFLLHVQHLAVGRQAFNFTGSQAAQERCLACRTQRQQQQQQGSTAAKDPSIGSSRHTCHESMQRITNVTTIKQNLKMYTVQSDQWRSEWQ